MEKGWGDKVWGKLPSAKYNQGKFKIHEDVKFLVEDLLYIHKTTASRFTVSMCNGALAANNYVEPKSAQKKGELYRQLVEAFSCCVKDDDSQPQKRACSPSKRRHHHS